MRPLVLMHGLLASSEAMSHIENYVKKDFPYLYIKNVEIGNGRDDSLLMNMNSQVENFANQILKDINLKNGFNVIGTSTSGKISGIENENFEVLQLNLSELKNIELIKKEFEKKKMHIEVPFCLSVEFDDVLSELGFIKRFFERKRKKCDLDSSSNSVLLGLLFFAVCSCVMIDNDKGNN